MTQVLERTLFETSRLLDFFTVRDLQLQTGLQSSNWPVVVLKELVDNALDACESAGVPPEIQVVVEDSPLRISVADNGPGMGGDTIQKLLDFGTRLSDKEAYVSPTRGAQGNALKTLLAIPFVLSQRQPQEGVVTFESGGICYRVAVKADLIAQRPLVTISQEPGDVKTGTRVAVCLPDYTSIPPEGLKGLFLQRIWECAFFNPHAIFTIKVGTAEQSWGATDPHWHKWLPTDPTSAHWYTAERLKRLVTAYIASGRDGGRSLTLREFVAQFRGFTGSAKQKAVTDLFPGVKRLEDMAHDGDVPQEPLEQLLAALKAQSHPVAPEVLGVIGEEHFRASMEAFGGGKGTYWRRKEGQQGLPYVVEVYSFEHAEGGGLGLVSGLNFTPTYHDPFQQVPLCLSERPGLKDGIYCYGLRGVLSGLKVKEDGPVTTIVHLAHPRLEFTERSKTTLAVSGSRGFPTAVAEGVWATHKDYYVRARRWERASRVPESPPWAKKPRAVSLQDAVFQVLPEAVKRASGSGALPFSVRQLYYQVRPLIQRFCAKELDYAYFTPPLVTEYQRRHGTIPGLVYDPRGHLIEPHSGLEVALGTKEVASYQLPPYQFNKVLYIEKEGFRGILEAAQFPARYDIALMTSKGYAVRAAKELLYQAQRADIAVLVAHDADISGYEIARTLEETTRTFAKRIKIIDLGLRVEEALSMGLLPEKVVIKHRPPEALLRRLNEVERRFLWPGGKVGQRVELNAMSSDQLVAWLEHKLRDYQLTGKVCPPENVVAQEWKGLLDEGLESKAESALREALEELGLTVSDFAGKVRAQLGGGDCGYDSLRGKLADNPGPLWRDFLAEDATNLLDQQYDRMVDMARAFVTERLRELRP